MRLRSVRTTLAPLAFAALSLAAFADDRASAQPQRKPPPQPPTMPPPTVAPPSRMPETLLGIVDEAGILTPIVRFDGMRWRNRWPAPDDASTRPPLPSSLSDVPIAWTGSPIPVQWHAWVREVRARERSGAREPSGPRPPSVPNDLTVQTIDVTTPVRHAAHCLGGIGLQSTLRSDQPPTPARSFPKRKLAVALSNADVVVEPVTALDLTSAADRDLLSAAARIFRSLATAVAAREQRYVPPNDMSVRWTKAWRYATDATDATGQVYLLEGRIGIDGAAEILTGFLWLRTRGDAVTSHQGEALVDDGVDFKLTSQRVPLGVISLGVRRFWLSEVHGYEDEAYEITDVSSPTLAVALRMSGGGC